MSENPFQGATRDPIGMLEQLIKITANIQADVAHLKERLETRMDRLEARMDQLDARMAQLEIRMDHLETRMDHLETRMDHLETRMDHLDAKVETLAIKVDDLSREVALSRGELRETRTEIVRLHKSRDQAYEGLKATVSAEIEQKSWYEAQRILLQVEDRYSALERRIAELEAAERRRREGAGA